MGSQIAALLAEMEKRNENEKKHLLRIGELEKANDYIAAE